MRLRQLTLVAVNQQVGPLTRITRPPSITLQRQIRRDVVVQRLVESPSIAAMCTHIPSPTY